MIASQYDLHLGFRVAVAGGADGGHAALDGGPERAGPVALMAAGIGEEGERLIAGRCGVGVDLQQVDLVFVADEVGDLIGARATTVSAAAKIVAAPARTECLRVAWPPWPEAARGEVTPTSADLGPIATGLD